MNNFEQLISDLNDLKKYNEIANECYHKKDYGGENEARQTKAKAAKDLIAANHISVVEGEGTNIGRCYNAYDFTVVSNEELPHKLIKAMRGVGLIGFGQEFYIGNSVENDEGKFETKVTNRVDSSD